MPVYQCQRLRMQNLRTHIQEEKYPQLAVRPCDMNQFSEIYCTFAMFGKKPSYAHGTSFRVTSDQCSFGQESKSVLVAPVSSVPHVLLSGPCIWFYCLFSRNCLGLRNLTPKEGFFLVCIGQAQVRSRPHNKWLELVDKPQEWKANLSTVSSLVLDTRLKFGTAKILLTTWVWPNNIKLTYYQNARAHYNHMSWNFKDPKSFSPKMSKSWWSLLLSIIKFMLKLCLWTELSDQQLHFEASHIC